MDFVYNCNCIHNNNSYTCTSFGFIKNNANSCHYENANLDNSCPNYNSVRTKNNIKDVNVNITSKLFSNNSCSVSGHSNKSNIYDCMKQDNSRFDSKASDHCINNDEIVNQKIVPSYSRYFSENIEYQSSICTLGSNDICFNPCSGNNVCTDSNDIYKSNEPTLTFSQNAVISNNYSQSTFIPTENVLHSSASMPAVAYNNNTHNYQNFNHCIDNDESMNPKNFPSYSRYERKNIEYLSNNCTSESNDICFNPFSGNDVCTDSNAIYENNEPHIYQNAVISNNYSHSTFIPTENVSYYNASTPSVAYNNNTINYQNSNHCINNDEIINPKTLSSYPRYVRENIEYLSNNCTLESNDICVNPCSTNNECSDSNTICENIQLHFYHDSVISNNHSNSTFASTENVLHCNASMQGVAYNDKIDNYHNAEENMPFDTEKYTNHNVKSSYNYHDCLDKDCAGSDYSTDISHSNSMYSDDIDGDNSSKKLSCMAINVGGLRSKLNFPSFLSFIKTYDVIVITESKFSDTDSVNILGYTPFYKNRGKFRRKSGGILLLVKDWLVQYVHIFENIQFKNKISDNQDRYIFVDHELSSRVLYFTIDKLVLDKTVLFCGCYIEGDNSNYFNRQAYAELEENLLNINCENVCLLGDFNSRSGNLCDVIVNNDHSDIGIEFDETHFLKRISKDKLTNTMGYELISFCKANQLAIVNGRLGEDQGVGEFTCKDASVVDYVILSHDMFQFVVNFKIHAFNELFSDCHNAISIQFELGRHAGESNGETKSENVNESSISGDEKQQKRVNWDKSLKIDYVNELGNEDILILGQKLDVLIKHIHTVRQEDVNDIVGEFNSILIQAANNLGMIKVIRKNKSIPKGNKKCWFTKECQMKRKAYYKARKKLLNNRNNDLFKEQTKKAAKIYKNTIKKCKRDFDFKVANEIRQLKSNDPKAYWNKLTLRNEVNKLQPKSEEFVNMFRSLANEINCSDEIPSHATYTNNEYQNDETDNYLNSDITEEEVQNAINGLRNNKAYGLDLIINEFLVNSSNKCIQNFVKLFNVVLNTGLIPHEWCIGIIKPLFKNKGSPKDANNYRGITILSCFGKLFTSVLNKRISCFVETYKILGLEQAGFRHNHSTSDHIFTLFGIIDILLAKKKRLYCAFLDYEKAFDKVDRVFLWQKLIEQNIKGKILQVINNIYNNAKSCVMVNNIQSQFFNVQCGVRQGENLSPLLFALFLNDMNDYIKNDVPGLETIIDECVACNMSESEISKFVNLYLLLYADDTVIFAENPSELQNRLNKVELYCSKWKLKLNVNKSKVVIFSRGKVRKFPEFTACGEAIEVVDSFLYLGLKLNHNNKMKIAQKDIYDRASRAMFALLKKCNTLNLPVDVILDLFNKTIVPILSYGSEIWGFDEFELLQKLQLRFYKIVLKLRITTPSLMVFGETGHYPLWVEVKVKMLMYWFKLISFDNRDKLSSNVYKLLYSLYSSGKYENAYLKCIRSCLIEVGLYHLWLSQDVSYIKLSIFKSHIKQCYKDLFLQQWYSKLDNDSIYINYRLFKTSFKQEYFLKSLPNNSVFALVKFRCINNPLPVNSLRFTSIPRHERICNNCNMNEIGDEYHYLFTCPYYQEKRTELLPKYYIKHPNVIKYSELLNSTESSLLFKLRQFICFINKSFINNK